MNKQNKLARNAIRARKAKNKRANEQDKPKKGKRWLIRLGALMGCLLLVSALVVPCFADYEQPILKPVEETIINVSYLGSGSTSQVDILGYYEIRFNSLGDGGVTPGTVLLQANGLHDILVYNIMTGEVFDVKTLYLRTYSDGRSLDVLFFTNPDFDGSTTNRIESASGIVLYVRQYPDFALNDTVWSELDYSVYKLVAPFKVGKVTSVWTDIMSWITNALASVQSIFYVNGSLTFLGTLSVIGVSIAIVFLIIGIVTRFLQLRG